MTTLLGRARKLVPTTFAAFFFLAAAGSSAQALCAAQDLDGTFNNVNPATRGITRVRLSFPCYDTGPRNGPVVWVQVWGKCHPRDCYWGRVPGTAVWSRTARQYVRVGARFRPSFAIKTVRVIRTGRRTARVWQFTRFTDRSGRRNYSSWESVRK